MATSTPRGIRNNNPGNLRRTRDKWQGLAPKQTDRAFFVFADACYGIRALARTLITYQDERHLRTVAKIIHRWAPPADKNDTPAYIDAVVRGTSVGAHDELDMHSYDHLRLLVVGIIHQENGRQPYTDAQIDKALALAGVEPKRKSLTKSKTVQAAQCGLGAGTVATGAGVVATIAPAVPVLQDVTAMIKENGSTCLIVMGALLIGFCLHVTYRRWDDHRRLAR